jgi:hypothetical protein
VPQQYEWFSPLAVHFPGVPHGHDLHVTGVGIDEYAIRIEYRITPALPNMRPPDAPQSNWRPPITWRWQASDDLGNSYEEYGGAYGASSDGLATQGVLSLSPLSPPGRQTLHVLLQPRVAGDHYECRFDALIDVPPAP